MQAPSPEPDLSRLLRALADPVRLEIVRYAHAHPGSACSAILADVPKSTASHHWKVLREAGLLHQEPAGRQKLNHLRKEDVDAAFPGLLDAVLRPPPASPPRGPSAA